MGVRLMTRRPFALHADDLLALLAGAQAVARPLSVYVNVPFCRTKCHFCDWVADIPVGQLRSSDRVRQHYVQALANQIAYIAPRLKELGYTPNTMYWGGARRLGSLRRS